MTILSPSKSFFKSELFNHEVYQRISGLEKSLRGIVPILLWTWGTAVLDMPISERPAGNRRVVHQNVVVHTSEIKPLTDRQNAVVLMGADRSLSRALRRSDVSQQIINQISACLSRKMVRHFRPNQTIGLTFESGVLCRVKVHTRVGKAFLIERHKNGAWSSKSVKTPVVVKYERLKLPITHTLKKALLSAAMDRTLTCDIARGLARSGVVWGNLKGAIVDLMVQTRRCSETKALVFDHIAMIQVSKKGHKKTYYAYQRGPNDSRRMFCTLAGFGLKTVTPSRGPMWCSPVSSGKITSSFGYRRHPVYRRIKYHKGVDYSGSHGSPIRSVGNGVVESVIQNKGTYGKYISIAHDNGCRTVYAHLSRTMVRPGQRVRMGQTIGGMGSTGNATGTHLHFEVRDHSRRPMNPEHFLSRTANVRGATQKREVSRNQRRDFYTQAQSLSRKYAELGGKIGTDRALLSLAAKDCTQKGSVRRPHQILRSKQSKKRYRSIKQ